MLQRDIKRTHLRKLADEPHEVRELRHAEGPVKVARAGIARGVSAPLVVNERAQRRSKGGEPDTSAHQDDIPKL